MLEDKLEDFTAHSNSTTEVRLVRRCQIVMIGWFVVWKDCSGVDCFQDLAFLLQVYLELTLFLYFNHFTPTLFSLLSE